MSNWIDFKELRTKLKFEQVLRYYQIEVKRKGEQHLGFCPLPGHKGRASSPSFSANLERGIFQCFGCGAKGSVFDFALLMENVDLKDGRAVRKVALKLRRELLADVMPVSSKRVPTMDRSPNAEGTATEVLVNAPLDFVLKDLETDNLCLLEEGLTASTVARFGLGFCSRGLLKGRVAIPLHDEVGKLVGYAGRVVDYGAVSEDNPEYLFPTTRERNGMVYEFKPELLLYNSCRQQPPCDELIVVGDFPSVWWLHQNGYPQTVSVMGSECSERQAETVVSLVKSSGRVWILPNGNKDGERLATSIMLQVSPHRFTRWVKLDESWRATDLTVQQVRKCFTV